jgi:hypothetical protein
VTFDPGDYRKRVLTPYKGPMLGALQTALRELKSDGSLAVPKHLDLATLYDVVPGMSDAAVSAQIAAVADVFAKTTSNAAFKSIAANLNELHSTLKSRNPGFTQAAFWQARLSERDQRSKGQLVDFAKDAAAELQSLGVVTPTRLRELARGAHITDTVSDKELADAVSAAGVLVMPEIHLPSITVPPAVTGDLMKTTCSSLIEAIFLDAPPASFSVVNGFRAANGAQLTLQRVRASRDLTDLRQSTENDHIKKVLGGVLGAAKTDADLQALVLAYFIDLGRTVAQSTSLQVMALKRLTHTGLERTDAARILSLFADRTKSAGFTDVQGKVADGKLREARRLFDALETQASDSRSDQMDKARVALEGAETRLATRRERARKAVEEGDIAAAAKALNDALTICTDDESLEEMVRALPPSAPLNVVVTTSQDGRSAIVTWQPGFGTTDDIQYRIIRKLGAAPKNAHDGEIVGHPTSATSCEDPRPPFAERVYYGVAALREGAFSPVRADAILIAPPVKDVKVSSDLTSITLHWDTPPGARSVKVTQTAPDGATTDVQVNAHSAATASGLWTGHPYTYILTASYTAADGSELQSRPVRIEGIPRGTASPVPSLDVRQRSGNQGAPYVEANWQEITGFVVEIWTFTQRPPWPYGSRISAAELAQRGRQLTGADIRAGSRRGVRGAVEAGLRHYVAVTRDGPDAVIGQSQELGICPDITGVHAERFHDWVVLSWDWPGEEFDVRVRWTGRDGSGDTMITHVQYQQQGGLRLQVGTAGAQFSLRTVPAQSTREWPSTEYRIEVPAAAALVRYDVVWHHRPLRPTDITVTFTAEDAIGPTGIVIVVKEGTVMPFGKNDGIAVFRGDLDFRQERVQVVTRTLPKLGRHYWVRAFAVGPDIMRLSDPLTDDLRGP